MIFNGHVHHTQRFMRKNGVEMPMDYQDREEVIKPGTIVRHFKRDLVTIYPNNPFQYLYEVVGEAEHTETGEELIVYQALYGGRKMYCRPKAMFLSKVDKRKYPDSVQTYRLEVARFNPDTGRYY